MLPSEIKSDKIVLGKATDLADFSTAKRLTEVLMKHYPGFMWGVYANKEHGMVTVRNFTLSGEWGFMLHYDKVVEDVEDKLTIHAGGEILERYRVSRGRANGDHLDSLPTDFAGRILVDAAGAQNVR